MSLLQISFPKLKCNKIPNDREKIPTSGDALSQSHQSHLADWIAPLDHDAKILLLLGRDILRVHKVHQQHRSVVTTVRPIYLKNMSKTHSHFMYKKKACNPTVWHWYKASLQTHHTILQSEGVNRMPARWPLSFPGPAWNARSGSDGAVMHFSACAELLFQT